jgi:3-oxoadipate enol-lactonase
MPKIRVEKGIEVNYDVWGEGPPLVLVHANPFDNTLWIYQIMHFSTYYRVISVDLRGYGRSSEVSSDFTIEDLANDVRAVCQECGVDQAIFGGISVGAAVIEQLATDHGEMVRGLIIAGSGYLRRGEPIIFAEKRAKDYEKGIGYRKEHIMSLVSESFQKTDLGSYLISIYLERNPITNAQTIKKLFQGFSKWQQPQVELFKCPALILVGEQDPAVDSSFELRRRIPNSEIVVIKGAGHACCLEKPAEFDAAVSDFLKRHGLLPSI